MLLSKITALATSNLAFIVETVYQDVREHRVKKNSIEAKIKEVGEKCKTQKVWVVKPDVKVSLLCLPGVIEPESLVTAQAAYGLT